MAIFGFGTVGKGVAEVLLKKERLLKNLIGDFKVVAIADSKSSLYGDFDLREAIEYKIKHGRLPRDERARDLFDIESFDLLIEATPTNVFDGEPGLGYIREALKRGINVVTSNKGPLVVAFKELNDLAEKKGVHLGYEATVGGAMPVIKLVKKDLAGNQIIKILGILNGTCNYILSRMESEKIGYDQIILEAQQLGIAEADPSYDVEGIDAAAKLVIIANSLLGLDAKFEDVRITGIKNITPEAFDVALKKGYTIRLIAEADEDGKLEVAPRLVKLTNPLAVYGTLNALLIKADLAKELFVIGRGAGKYETASAIISDIIDIYAR